MKRNESTNVALMHQLYSAISYTLSEMQKLRCSLVARPNLKPDNLISEVDQVIRHCEDLKILSKKIAEQSAMAEKKLDKAESQMIKAKLISVISFVKTLLDL